MKHRMLSAALIATALATLLAGCAAPVTDRVILLPQADGRPSAVEVSAGSQRLLLAQPYASAQLAGGQLVAAQTDAAGVQAAYGQLLAQQPARPRSFTVNFEPNGNKLTAGAEPVLAEMRTLLAALPVPEVVITGHTDRVGSLEANDKLALSRAEAVRELLVAAGVSRTLISVVGRGEREPLVPTADEVAEARNRRVEIKVR